MGIAKAAMMKQQEHEALSSALHALIEHERITNPVGVGLAKLVADKGVGALSGGQIDTYEKHVAPLLDITCNMCTTSVPMVHVADVLGNEFEEGELLCMDCLHQKQKYSKE